MEESHAATTDSLLPDFRLDPSSIVNLYTEILSRLESLLRDDQSFLGHSDLILLNFVNDTWLKVRTWGHDIDQENTDILQTLAKFAKPLAEDVFEELDLICWTLEHLDGRLHQKTNIPDSEATKRLVEAAADAATKLGRLAEPIMDLQEDKSDDKMRGFIERALQGRAEPAEVAPGEVAAESGAATIEIPEFQGLSRDFSPSSETRRCILTSLLRTVKSRPFIPISKDEVRLATIHPGRRKDSLRCSISVTPIAKLSQYEYEALSYCWPDDLGSSFQTTVLIQDEGMIQIHDSNNPQLRSPAQSIKKQASRRDTKHENIIMTELPVSRIVFEALDALRREDRKVTVWVDAICLDLKNEDEKRTQSLNFSEIFFQATSVTHYLSTSNDLIEFREQFDAVDRIIGNFETESAATSKIHKGSQLGTPYEDLLRLMNKSFSRRWVVQEFVLARKVTLRAGERTLAWSKFADAMRLWQRLESCCRPGLAKNIYRRAGIKGTERTVSPAERILETMEKMSRKESTGHVIRSPFMLQYLVYRFSSYEFASNSPRDAVGAFLSIATDVVKFSPPKDIHNLRKLRLDRGIRVAEPWTASSKMSTLDMFVNYVEHCIQQMGSLDVICSHWAPSDSGPLPSWIKARTHKKSLNHTMVPFTGNATQYHAADSTKPVCRFVASSDSNLCNPQPSGLQASDTPSSITYDPKTRFYNIVEEAMKAKRLEKNHKLQNRQILFAQGVLLGHVEEVSARIVGGVITRECLELGGIIFSDQDRWNPEDISPTLWRTLVADTSPTGAKAPGIYQRIMSYCLNESVDGDLDPRSIRRPGQMKDSTFHSIHVEHSESSSYDSADPEVSTRGEEADCMLNKFLNHVRDVTHNRKLFRARNDELFGLAPAAAAVGDAICILFGCSVPVILRERLSEGAPGANPYFELIDECYVDGIMAREVIIELEKEELEAQTVEFEIR